MESSGFKVEWRKLTTLNYDYGVKSFLHQWYDDSSYIVAYTSGSTGNPKEIHLLKRDMIASAKLTCDFFGIESSSLLHLPLSVDYIAGKMMIVRAIYSGASLFAERPSNTPLNNIRLNDRIALSAIVPSQIPGLIDSENFSLIDNLIIGGAPITEDAEQTLLDSGINAYCTYGMTETCSHIALRHIGTDFFTALGDVTICSDDRGCLVADTPHLSVRRVVTNDLVEIIDNRHFKWLGRIDNVINTGGIKVFPEDIERRISHLFGNIAFYISSRESAKWGREIVLMIESAHKIPDLEQSIREVLPSHLVPKAIIYSNFFERTSTGKIKRINPH